MDETNSLNNESKYKQLTLGTDFTFSYSYFEFSGEYIYNLWKAPKFAVSYIVDENTGKVLDFDLISHMGYVDIKSRYSFFSGTFCCRKI